MSGTPRQKWYELIMAAAKELKLPMIRQHLEEQVTEAMQKDASYEEFLALLLQQEWDARKESARYNRIRRAEFPHKKYLESLSIGDLPPDAQKKLKLLKSLAFIQEGRRGRGRHATWAATRGAGPCYN